MVEIQSYYSLRGCVRSACSDRKPEFGSENGNGDLTSSQWDV